MFIDFLYFDEILRKHDDKVSEVLVNNIKKKINLENTNNLLNFKKRIHKPLNILNYILKINAIQNIVQFSKIKNIKSWKNHFDVLVFYSDYPEEHIKRSYSENKYLNVMYEEPKLGSIGQKKKISHNLVTSDVDSLFFQKPAKKQKMNDFELSGNSNIGFEQSDLKETVLLFNQFERSTFLDSKHRGRVFFIKIKSDFSGEIVYIKKLHGMCIFSLKDMKGFIIVKEYFLENFLECVFKSTVQSVFL